MVEGSVVESSRDQDDGPWMAAQLVHRKAIRVALVKYHKHRQQC